MTDWFGDLNARIAQGLTSPSEMADRKDHLIACAERYMLAVERLGEESGYNRLTYFEAPILKMPNDDMRRKAHERWLELNNAGQALAAAVQHVRDVGAERKESMISAGSLVIPDDAQSAQVTWRPEPLLNLADDYEAGLKRCAASGYEEYGPDWQARHQMVIDALRFAAAQPPAAPVETAPEAGSIKAALRNIAENAVSPEFREALHSRSSADTSELLPCPFCGGEPSWTGDYETKLGNVSCENSDCFGPRTTAARYDDAAVQWNTRAQPQAAPNRQRYVAELKLNGRYTWCIVEAIPRVEKVIQEFGFGPDAQKAADDTLALSRPHHSRGE